MTPAIRNAALLLTALPAAVVVVRVVGAVGSESTQDSKTPPAQTGRGFLF